jgi:hypothetical protein
MPAKSRTAYFTKRGNHFGNLWSVYSLKANQALQLGSDRQLAHWLLWLEFSPAVIDFRFKPDSKFLSFSIPDNIDYHFEVMPVEGVTELHYIRTEGHSPDYSERVRSAETLRYKYIEFNDESWLAQKGKILSLLKLSSFLSGGRHVYLPPQLISAAIASISIIRKGRLDEYLSSMSIFDSNLSLLAFCRMYSERKLDVSFESNFFSRNTLWWIYE